ncbi:ATP phosphoribosyltransferase [Rhabdaerophilum sp. SD176]|uniref:ATP phosphoribosyltransferase n=1 Tax=Rhabdaerophilum sp. SD176 TaxID=2983548 RepID=UPI0024DFC84E|nr:ATP phosphoribosyltransferase [Rhabdaerophilum sp. SD176]
MTDAPLTIGIPSKGRLQENTFAFFARAGMPIIQPRGARDYRGAVKGLDGIEIAFLSASEIAGELARGAVHFGVTGADLLHEQLAEPAAKVEMLAPLGFGHANVVVAVPEAWIDVHDMADIEEVAADFRHRKQRRLRVATKYVNLTRRFFKKHGIADYRIVESLGATEGAPAAGTAEIIVDITTTGATLAANALKVLDDGTMLKSEANLVASLQADWSPDMLERARSVLARIHAEEEARSHRRVAAYFGGPVSEAARVAAQNGRILAEGPQEVTLFLPKDRVAETADTLLRHGAERVLVSEVDYAFSIENPLFDKLNQALDGRRIADLRAIA